MLTYQEGNILYIQHQFLKDVIAQCGRHQDPMSFRVGWMLEGSKIKAPKRYNIKQGLRFVCIYWVDEKIMSFSFEGECENQKSKCLKFTAELKFSIQISDIKSFDSSATNGYFPVKLDF